jgi:glycosyltransferase involved in cell wall biosynthesis
VLFVGYLTKAKGTFDLLKAMTLVVADQPNIRFQLMGTRIDVERNITYVDNPDSNEATLQQLLGQKELAECVELLGVQSGSKKNDTFVNADIFVLPSYAEAFPTVVLEAMAAGLPVVATPVGALPEVFDERNILFVEPGDVSQLAASILQLAQNPNHRQEIGSYNRQVVQQHFDLSAYAVRIDTVIADLLQPHSEGGQTVSNTLEDK